MASSFKVDYAGVGEVLRSSEMAAAVEDLAEQVAENARAQGHTTSDGTALPVDVSSYTTDRAAAAVTLAHPAGEGMEAKYGVLTSAAAAAGLEVSGG